MAAVLLEISYWVPLLVRRAGLQQTAACVYSGGHTGGPDMVPVLEWHLGRSCLQQRYTATILQDGAAEGNGVLMYTACYFSVTTL